MAKVDYIYRRLTDLIKNIGYEYSTENRPEEVMKQINKFEFSHDLSEEFPALTLKKLPFSLVVTELLWFLRGDDNVKFLVENGCNIWTKDAYNYYNRLGGTFTFAEFQVAIKENDICSEEIVLENEPTYKYGSVGKNYGVQWTDFGGVDQIEDLVVNLKKVNPFSRRHIVTAWNPSELGQTALPPCHWAFEVIPYPMRYHERIDISGGDKVHLNAVWSAGEYQLLDKKLAALGVPKMGFELIWYQRSVDTFLGLPFNIASYGVLANLIGALTGLVPRTLTGRLTNVHTYGSHKDALLEYEKNHPMSYPGTQIKFSESLQNDILLYNKKQLTFRELIERIEVKDITLANYQSYPSIKAEMIAPKK